MRNRAVIIGLGGIGSWVAQGLCPFLNYQKDSLWDVVLVDGDDYEESNNSRQIFPELGPKAQIQANWIKSRFPKLGVQAIDKFVTDKHTDEDTINIREVIRSNDIVFSCVDNHRTRKIIADGCNSLITIALISGGNEMTDGGIQIFIKVEGENRTCTTDQYHPELKKPTDKAPFEKSCEELMKSEPQLIMANLNVASIMLNAFYGILNDKFVPEQSEIYFDIILNKVTPRERKK